MRGRAVLVGLVGALVAAHVAYDTPASGAWISARFSAPLSPAAVVPSPRETAASGRVVGVVGSDVPGCVYGCLWARYRVTFRTLSGPPTGVVVRFGRVGEIGGVWHRLCIRSDGVGDCPRSRTGVLRGSFGLAAIGARTVRETFPRHVYLEISTARNPHGELRGQIELR
jgi:hypothetical protein